MKLNTKITAAAGLAVIATAVGACATVYWLSARNRANALREQMAVVLRQAETVADKMDRMHQSGAFDTEGLIATAKKQSGSRPLKETYRESAIYNTIPIVASWQAAEKSAADQGFQFFTPSHPDVPARNPKNAIGRTYAQAFEAFERGENEFFYRDEETNELVLARPTRMSGSCLECHGDPKLSPDGKDIFGFPMENLQLGDVKGAFVLRAPLTGDPVVLQTVRDMSFVSLGLLGVTALGFFGFARRYIDRPLNHAVMQLNDSSELTASWSSQIAGSSQTLAEGATEQAASLEETSASLEEMTGMTKQNADNAENARRTAQSARAAADAGARQMEAMQAAMSAIKEASEEITKILHSIDEIAFQTNILALNAAVEAARAGEAGAGFAVVADEVRALAQRCATASRETSVKIEACVQKSQHGVTISSDAAQSFQSIQSHIRELDRLVNEIAQATREQSQGLSQVATAVSQMDSVTQTSASTAEESASAAQELEAQAKTLKSLVHTLQEMTGAAHRSATAPDQPLNDTAGGAAPASSASPGVSGSTSQPRRQKPSRSRYSPSEYAGAAPLRPASPR